MTMAARIQLLVAFAVLAASGTARAKVYIELRPRLSLMGGYDDNVELKGTGGDSFGQAVPGLKLDLFGDHDLHLGLDCQAGVARLAHPQEFGISSGAFASNETCLLGTKVKVSERDRLGFNARATYAQDPFSIAGLGLLLRPGQTQIFVATFGAEEAHKLSGHSEVDFGIDTYGLFFRRGDPGNGYMIAPRAAYAWKTSARSKWSLGVREQLFFGVGASPNPLAPRGAPAGLLDEAHTALLGYTYALAPWAELTMQGGPVLITGSREAVQPTLRLEIVSYTPTTALRLTVGHDLIVGASNAGPIIGDIAEVGVEKNWEHFGAHLRLGIYRNASAFDSTSLGTLGYGGEAGLAWKLTRDLRLETAALRDARLNDVAAAQQVDRNVIQVRLVWEKVRFD
jgi:hypothetical protein